MHLIRKALLTLSLVSSVLSLVFKSEEKEVDFDERRIQVDSFQQLNSVGTYGGLRWDGFSIVKGSEGGDDIGVEYKSKPNCAGAPVDPFGFGTLPSITSDYDESDVAFFDLERLWWGCSTPDPETQEHFPGWCTLEVYGYAHGVKDPVAKQTSFFFPKDNPTSMPMVETLLPSTFNAVTRIEFNVVATRPILYLDNVKYKIYNVTAIGKGLREVENAQESSQSEFHMQIMGAEAIAGLQNQ